jgi:hypothetical protein
LLSFISDSDSQQNFEINPQKLVFRHTLQCLWFDLPQTSMSLNQSQTAQMGRSTDRSHLDHSSMILLPPTIVGLNDTTLPAESVVSNQGLGIISKSMLRPR